MRQAPGIRSSSHQATACPFRKEGQETTEKRWGAEHWEWASERKELGGGIEGGGGIEE
jgi:hypothetical protein